MSFVCLGLGKPWLIDYLNHRHHGVAEAAGIPDTESSRKHNTCRMPRIPALESYPIKWWHISPSFGFRFFLPFLGFWGSYRYPELLTVPPQMRWPLGLSPVTHPDPIFVSPSRVFFLRALLGNQLVLLLLKPWEGSNALLGLKGAFTNVIG